MSDLIGQRCKIVGYSETGASLNDGTEFVAHVCLDLDDGRRVCFQADDDPHVVLTVIIEPGSAAA